VLLCTLSLAAWSQQEPPAGEKRKEKVEALKRSFYSEKLELTPAEAEKFWPIYNEFKKKEDALKKDAKGEKKKGEAPPKLSEKEVLTHLDQSAQQKKAHIDLETQFYKDCLPVLGPDRVMQLTKIDREFQRELLQHMKERKEGGKGPKK
jgi:hypothetical protein